MERDVDLWPQLKALLPTKADCSSLPPWQDPVEYDVDLWNAGRGERAIVHVDLSA